MSIFRNYRIETITDRPHKEDMKHRGLASTDLGDCLSMTFAVDIAFRSQRTSQLVYQFPSPNAWMGY